MRSKVSQEGPLCIIPADSYLQQAEWRQEAVSSIQYVRSLSSELSDREETLQDKVRTSVSRLLQLVNNSLK